MFDEGHNNVAMNLPRGVEIINSKIRPPVEPQILPDHPVSLARISNKIEDVEYDSDYEEDENMFNGIESLDHHEEEKPNVEHRKIRDYSIDLWNGSPGLKHWGYSDTNSDR